MGLNPEEFVQVFTRGMEAVDATRPTARNRRTNIAFGAGLGPHSEDAALRLVVEEVAGRITGCPEVAFQVGYPEKPSHKADLRLTWASGAQALIEAKLFRVLGDNGKPNDNILMHILSPYPQHRSAVTDVRKLLRTPSVSERAILIFGYEAPDFPAELALHGFELLAREICPLGPRHQSWTADLIHPVHRKGFAAMWVVEAG